MLEQFGTQEKVQQRPKRGNSIDVITESGFASRKEIPNFFTRKAQGRKVCIWLKKRKSWFKKGGRSGRDWNGIQTSPLQSNFPFLLPAEIYLQEEFFKNSKHIFAKLNWACFSPTSPFSPSFIFFGPNFFIFSFSISPSNHSKWCNVIKVIFR